MKGNFMNKFKLTIMVVGLMLSLVLQGCNLTNPTTTEIKDQENVKNDNSQYLSVVSDESRQYYRNYKRERIMPNSMLSKTLQGTYGNFTDATGKVQIGVWRSEGYGQHVTVDCDIDPDYVVIGGGAETDYQKGWGALITANYPLSNALTTWEGRSKDHDQVNYHTLYVYAIGLKLEGVDRNALFNQMSLTSANSGTTNHPGVGCNVPVGKMLIGGGAMVDFHGYGQALVSTYPSSQSGWYGSSKDHLREDKSSITTFAIGINPVIPGFGTLLFQRLNGATYASTSIGAATQRITSGWVLTCPGGRSTYQGWGRMLFQVSPGPDYNPNSVQVKSKDHVKADCGYTYAYAVMIKKK